MNDFQNLKNATLRAMLMMAFCLGGMMYAIDCLLSNLLDITAWSVFALSIGLLLWFGSSAMDAWRLYGK